MSRNCFAIFHSCEVNAYWLNLWSGSATIDLMGFWYDSAKSNISNVDFHLVATSRGMFWMVISLSPRSAFHAGNKSFVEWLIL
jgi:hypothetical protein